MIRYTFDSITDLEQAGQVLEKIFFPNMFYEGSWLGIGENSNVIYQEEIADGHLAKTYKPDNPFII